MDFQRAQTLDAKYGLPPEVHFCKRCVLSNQKPNSAIEHNHTSASKKQTVVFDEEGICDACRFAEEKKRIDWKAREKELREICDEHRSTDGSYDCLVPGSGGKDSFYTAHILKYVYGMHPLTVTWAPHIYTSWGWKNFQQWIHAGFDNELFTPNGRVHRLITRLAVDNLFHPFQPFIIGQKSFAPTRALLHGIKLVFVGEHEAEYGNARAEASSPLRDPAFFTSADTSNLALGGVPIKQLTDEYGLSMNDLKPYLPVHPELIQKAGVEVRYLGYYLRWHPQECYYYAVKHGDFEPAPERSAGTYSIYNSLDDKMDDLYYYTAYIKFGIGRATYDAAQEIRSGDITREEGMALVKKFDGEFPERFFEELCAYLSMDERVIPRAKELFSRPMMDRAYFDELANRFRSEHLWENRNGEWRLRNTIQ